jgi:hypothetical protein
MGKTKAGKFDGRTTTASVTPHPIHADCWAGTVETPRGEVFTLTYRRDTPPTAAEVLAAWKANRRDFNPGYN